MSKEIEFDTSQFDRFIARAQAELTKPVVAEIVTDGDPVKYWAVWEFGGKGKKPGKRTRRGKGGRIFSNQAPQGYVFRHGAKFFEFLRDAYARIAGSPSRQSLITAANEAANRAAELIKASAPVDSGALKDSIAVKDAS